MDFRREGPGEAAATDAPATPTENDELIDWRRVRASCRSAASSFSSVRITSSSAVTCFQLTLRRLLYFCLSLEEEDFIVSARNVMEGGNERRRVAGSNVVRQRRRTEAAKKAGNPHCLPVHQSTCASLLPFLLSSTPPSSPASLSHYTRWRVVSLRWIANICGMLGIYLVDLFGCACVSDGCGCVDVVPATDVV
jgi:hypothetical protein